MSKVPASVEPSPLPASWEAKRIGCTDQAAKRVPALRTLFRQRDSFANVDDQTIDQLEKHMPLLAFSDGEVICREGTPAESTFVVVTGQAEVVRTAPDGSMIMVNVLQPGDWGGIMGLTGKGKRLARLSARGDTVVRAIGHDQLVKLMDVLPGLGAALLASMGQRMRDDAAHLTATLQHVGAVGLDEDVSHYSPNERIMLDTIRHRVAAAESLSQIMDYVFDSIPHEQDVRMTLAFLEDPGGRVDSYWSRANYLPLVLPENFQEDLSGSLVEESYRTAVPTIINQLEDFACHHPFNQGAVKRVKEGLQSSMVAPLRVGDRVAGFLICSVRRADAFDGHDLRIHQAVADSICPVVEKAFRIEMLTKANNDYGEVLSFISHELQSPIASMVTDAQLMHDGYLGAMNDKQQAKLARTIAKGEYLLRMIREFLNLSRLEEGSLTPTMESDVDLRLQVIQPSLELLDSDFDAHEITVQCHVSGDPPAVQCDPGLLRIAVSNLLRNAITYGREGGEIRVTLEPEKWDEDSVSIVVWNAGPGFSPSLRSRLFRKFSRLDEPELRKKKGTGIGLYSTWRIMQLHGGHATAQSKQGEWAEFKLTLPIKSRSPGK